MAKPLYKLREGRIISGVCTDTDYVHVDVEILR